MTWRTVSRWKSYPGGRVPAKGSRIRFAASPTAANGGSAPNTCVANLPWKSEAIHHRVPSRGNRGRRRGAPANMRSSTAVANSPRPPSWKERGGKWNDFRQPPSLLKRRGFGDEFGLTRRKRVARIGG